ncbi:hypothetical protein [Adhaeribacter aquaticus]|uniref:hypothetical protein n=1 Tax=Adhaeribacter aquaticus TaxID=299567 RepID=UPI00041ECF12|nr:hypothetical protein [Adhaeribacter aquaticus]
MPGKSLYFKTYKVTLLNFFILIIISGCNSKKIDLPGFNQEEWRQDERSCGSRRPNLLPGFRAIRKKLIGLNHYDIITIFGKPEGESLEASGQRIYYYFVEAGPQCQERRAIKGVEKVAIKFDVLDRVNEIIFVKD